MDRAGVYFRPLSGDELKTVFDLVADGRAKDVQAKLRHHPKTITRACSVALALFRHGTGPLSDEEAEEIAWTARYGTTPHYVQQLFVHYMAYMTKDRKGKLREEMAQVVKEQEHSKDIWRLIDEIQYHLPFWPPQYVHVLDISTGAIATPFAERPPLYWKQGEDGHCLRKLDEKDDRFSPVIEHLESSGQRDILEALEQWRELGGRCIQQCHLLRVEIKQETERRTGLKTLFSDSSQPVQPGLWEGFSWTIYTWAVGPIFDWEYTVTGESSGLRLLSMRGHARDREPAFCLAWVSSDELERVRGVHERLREEYRQSALAKEIHKLKGEIAEVNRRLEGRLAEFSSQTVIPGSCEQCRDQDSSPRGQPQCG